MSDNTIAGQAFIKELVAFYASPDKDLNKKTDKIVEIFLHHLDPPIKKTLVEKLYNEIHGKASYEGMVMKSAADASRHEIDVNALQESNERYDLAAKATQDIIWDWDLQPDGKYITGGYSPYKSFGRNDGKTDLTDWGADIHPDDKVRVLAHLKETIEDPKEVYWEDEYRFILKNDETVYIQDCGYIVTDDNHKPLRMVGAMHDITKLKLMEVEREHITADLMQRNSDLEQFTYIVSHNLRSPISNIMGLADVLKKGGYNELEQAAFIDDISYSIKKLDDVIKDLNRILQVKREISEIKEEVSFTALVNDIKGSISQLLHERDVLITVDFTAIDHMYSLKTYLYSIFYNLIANAIKYQRVGIRPEITIKSELVGNKIVLLFTDNGLGINMDKYGTRLFGLYKRFHTNIDGKGVGLFMTKIQVTALNGKISVTSKVDEGTQFKIELENTITETN